MKAMALAVMALALAACGGPAPVPTATPAKPSAPPVAATTPAAKPAQEVAAVTRAAAETGAPIVPKYDARGHRDPFDVLSAPEGAASTSVATARLTGIVHGVTPLVLVETPDGLGYILKTGDTLGDGRLMEIGVNTAVFAVMRRPGGTNRVVLRLAVD